MADAAGHRLEIDARGVARLTLDRADKHNSFNAALVAGLTQSFEALARGRSVRVLVVAGEGPSFSAGADLDWMREQAQRAEAQNLDDARRTARMFNLLDRLPMPTVARVHGPAIGGGVGLAACCDIAIASTRATFALTEVKLGLIPAMISPYVIAAIGARETRRLSLTAETFGADEARRLGLIHEVVTEIEIDRRIDALVEALLANAPAAMAEAKDLVRAVAGRPIDESVIEDTAQRIARRRASDEARERIEAFLAKRAPGTKG